MVRIVWTELSIGDLKEIFDYISEYSIRYATITVNKIYQKTQVLKVSPHAGRIVPEFNEHLIREVISGNYRIIYRIISEVQVDVLRIYHIARLLKKDSM